MRRLDSRSSDNGPAARGSVGRGAIPTGSANSFAVKLDDAIASLNAGDTAGACMDLQDFINEVNAQTQPPKTKLLTPARAQSLINRAQQIKALIACP